jgi:hypothetical protein
MWTRVHTIYPSTSTRLSYTMETRVLTIYPSTSTRLSYTMGTRVYTIKPSTSTRLSYTMGTRVYTIKPSILLPDFQTPWWQGFIRELIPIPLLDFHTPWGQGLIQFTYLPLPDFHTPWGLIPDPISIPEGNIHSFPSLLYRALNSADHPKGKVSYIDSYTSYLNGFHTVRIHSGISSIQEFIHHLCLNSSLLSYCGSIPSTGVIHCYSWGRILGRNPDKSLQNFPSCYSQSFYSFALRFAFLQTHATSYILIQFSYYTS